MKQATNIRRQRAVSSTLLIVGANIWRGKMANKLSNNLKKTKRKTNANK